MSTPTNPRPLRIRRGMIAGAIAGAVLVLVLFVGTGFDWWAIIFGVAAVVLVLAIMFVVMLQLNRRRLRATGHPRRQV